jgi:hypothetical protein
MGLSTESTGDRATRLLAAVAIAALASVGCESGSGQMNGPVTAIDPNGTKPSKEEITTSDGSALPCFANSRACGSFLTSIGGPISNRYVVIGPNQMGAWTRTWSPSQENGYMSAIGNVTTRRRTGRNERQVTTSIGIAITALKSAMAMSPTARAPRKGMRFWAVVETRLRAQASCRGSAASLTVKCAKVLRPTRQMSCRATRTGFR